MKSNKARVFAWIFFALMMLSLVTLIVQAAFYITAQDWMPYEFVFKLPFAIKLDYVMLNAAILILLFLFTLLFFACARRRARKNREAAEAALEEEPAYYLEEPTAVSCRVAPTKTANTEAQDLQQQIAELISSETVQKVAKIAVPVLGACIVGAMVASTVRNHQKAKRRREFYRWLG